MPAQKAPACVHTVYVSVHEEEEEVQEKRVRECVGEDFPWITLQENLIEVLSLMTLPPQGVKQA